MCIKQFHFKSLVCLSGGILLIFLFFVASFPALAQNGGTGAIQGIITDQMNQPLSDIRVVTIKEKPWNALSMMSPGYSLFYPPWIPEEFLSDEEMFNPPPLYYSPYGSYYNYYYDPESLYQPEPYSTLTQQDGSYLLDSLPEGRYTVWAYDTQNRGLVPKIFGNSKNLPSIPVSVRSGATSGPVNMEMVIGGGISGSVTDESDGSPIAGVRIMATLLEEAFYSAGGYYPFYYSYYPSVNPGFGAISDDSGNFELQGIPEGEYIISVIKAEGYIINTAFMEPDTYHVSAGQTNTDCGLVLARGSSISGTITNQANAEPVADAYVSCQMTNTDYYSYYYQPFNAMSLEDGTYSITGLLPGTYIPMVLYAPDFYGVYYPGTYNPQDAQEIDLGAEEHLVSIDFQLAPVEGNASISGNINDKETGAPVSDITVRLNRLNPYGQDVYAPEQTDPYTGYTSTSSIYINPIPDPIPLPVKTDEEGGFEFSNLEPGEYWLEVFDTSGNYLQTNYPDVEWGDWSYIRLAEDQHLQGIQIPLKKGGCLEGQVTDGSSSPLPGVQVNIYEVTDNAYPVYGGYYGASYSSYYMPNYSQSSSVTDTEGSFIICGINEGSYVLWGDDLMERGYMPSIYPDPNNPEEAGIIEVLEGETASGLDLQMEPGAVLSGTVTDTEGNPLEGIYLYAYSSRIYEPDSLYFVYSRPYYTLTDENGQYNMVGLMEDTYMVTAVDIDTEYLSSDYSDVNVTISGNNILDFVLYRDSTISGSVTTMDGQPLSGIIINVYASFSEYPNDDGTYSGYPVYTDQNTVYSGYGGGYTYPDYDTNSTYSGTGDYTYTGYIPDIAYPVSSSDPALGLISPDSEDPSLYGGYYSTDTSAQYDYLYNQVYTIEDGSYHIDGLQAGYYQIEAVDPQGIYVGYITTEGTNSAIKEIELGVEEDIFDVNLSLAVGGVISGTVTDAATGEPVSDIIVSADYIDLLISDSNDTVPGSTPEPSTADTNDSSYTTTGTPGTVNPYVSYASKTFQSKPTNNLGEYIIQGLPGGSYTLYIEQQKDYQKLYHPAASNPGDAVPVNIELNQTITGMDFGLNIGLVISGTVKDALTGMTITSWGSVILRDELQQEISRINVNASGEYRFGGLYPGQYFIYANFNNYYPSYYTAEGDPQTPVPIILEDQSAEGIDVLLSPMASISGKVLDELDQTPLRDIWVVAISEAYSGYYGGYYYPYNTAFTDSNGPYTIIGLTEGDYKLAALDPLYIYAGEYYIDTPLDQPDQATIIHLDSSQQLKNIDMELHVGETYSGTIISPYTPPQLYTSDPNAGYYPSYYGYGGYGGAAPLYSQPTQNQGWAANFLSQESYVDQNSPRIVSDPDDNAIAGKTYTYQILLEDPQLWDMITFSLRYAPSEMSIDPGTGLVKWKPTNDDAGTSTVQVAAYNGQNRMITQSFLLSVEPDNTPPEEVQNLSAQAGNRLVKLLWEPSEDTNNDLIDQILYIDLGEGFGDGINLGKTTTEYLARSLDNNREYRFKITTIDNMGNESDGVIVTAIPKTPQTYYPLYPQPQGIGLYMPDLYPVNLPSWSYFSWLGLSNVYPFFKSTPFFQSIYSVPVYPTYSTLLHWYQPASMSLYKWLSVYPNW